MEKEWMLLLQQQNQLEQIMAMNEATEKYGLSLSEEDARMIASQRQTVLQQQRRVEFGEGIVKKIIQVFCDSPYIEQTTYAETIVRLQEIFYLYKNEMEDELTDDELLELMKEQFDSFCFGDLEYLESTGLANFARAVRAGYGQYGRREDCDQFETVTRWDEQMYREALEELCGWR